MKSVLLSLGLLMSVSASAFAQTNTTFVVTPLSPVFSANNIVGVALDSAPGFKHGSFKSDGSGKTDMYFSPETLFGREVKVGEVQSMSYWTKKGLSHAVEPRDWYLVVYTKPYAGQLLGGWYGVRLGMEPYFATNLSDIPNEWNEWSTAGPVNQLRVFESTYNYFGSYSDPTWQVMKGQTSLAGSRGPGVPYASQPIRFFSVQTGSGTATGFTGQVDGLKVVLTDGSVANVNFEPFLVAGDMESCKKGGWSSLFRPDGSSFQNQGDCVSYTTTGK